MMTRDEQRIAKLVREVDRERTARIAAERKARILRVVITRMRAEKRAPEAPAASAC
jgi:hypothetical protein